MKFLFLLILMTLSLPGLSQEDDEAFIEEVAADRRQQSETALKILESKKQVSNVPEEIRKLGYESININTMMDERAVKAFQKMLLDSNLKSPPLELISRTILEKVKGTYAETFLQDHPRLLACVSDIIRDKRAMASALGIFLRKDDLKIYSAIWIGFLILSWLFKKIFLNPKWGRGKTFIMSLSISLVFTGASFYTFYKMFESELSPTKTIIERHYDI
jgi:hypothetical protein